MILSQQQTQLPLTISNFSIVFFCEISFFKIIHLLFRLAAVLVDIKMLSPGSSIVHRGKVQKAVSKYGKKKALTNLEKFLKSFSIEDAEREEFSHLIEVRNKVVPDADEPFTFHGVIEQRKKFSKIEEFSNFFFLFSERPNSVKSC